MIDERGAFGEMKTGFGKLTVSSRRKPALT
jgi:hypothetical protein